MEKSQPRGDDHDDRPKEKATDVSLPNNSRRESKNTIDKNLKRKSTEIENQALPSYETLSASLRQKPEAFEHAVSSAAKHIGSEPPSHGQVRPFSAIPPAKAFESSRAEPQGGGSQHGKASRTRNIGYGSNLRVSDTAVADPGNQDLQESPKYFALRKECLLALSFKQTLCNLAELERFCHHLHPLRNHPTMRVDRNSYGEEIFTLIEQIRKIASRRALMEVEYESLNWEDGVIYLWKISADLEAYQKTWQEARMNKCDVSFAFDGRDAIQELGRILISRDPERTVKAGIWLEEVKEKLRRL